MSTVTLDPQDLATYLGVTDVNTDRAVMLLQMAWDMCESIVSPLPAVAVGVVLEVAARAYSSPVGDASQTAGPFSMGATPGGLYLSRSNKATLRRMGGGGGAFTIETCPDTAGANLPWWDVSGATDALGDLPDWDVIP